MAYTNIYYHVGSICASLASSTRSRRFFCPLPSTLGHTQKQNYVNRRRLSLGVFHFDIVALGPEPQRPQFDCCVAYRELASSHFAHFLPIFSLVSSSLYTTHPYRHLYIVFELWMKLKHCVPLLLYTSLSPFLPPSQLPLVSLKFN